MYLFQKLLINKKLSNKIWGEIQKLQVIQNHSDLKTFQKVIFSIKFYCKKEYVSAHLYLPKTRRVKKLSEM